MTASLPSDLGASDSELARLARRTGPILFLRGAGDGRVRLAALLVRPDADGRPTLRTAEAGIEPTAIFERYGLAALHYAFDLPMAGEAWYEIEDERHALDTDFAGDLRIAFVSCNGQEEGDRERPPEERNVLWARLGAQHEESPLNLLLHGGDQIYADEVLNVHPVTREWGRENGDPGEGAVDRIPEIVEALRRALFQRYLELYGQPEIARMLARVPSLAMWDDHDICDGWGSLPDRKLDSPVGKAVFSVAREHFLLFQMGASEESLPETCLDPSGVSLSWRIALPGLHVVAPDLRSERRRDRVMGPNGWRALDEAFEAAEGGRVILLSSVPALGPRLSIVEGLMRLTPVAEKYEDDLRDQWQSRTHRQEWRDFLSRLISLHERPGTRVTVVSGEIHLATRGTLGCAGGAVHQLVASGITHPPPPALYARTLGALASFGERPLAEHPIRLHPLPGTRTIYTARRNYLMLVREGGEWRAWWELDGDGATPPLHLG